MAQVLLILFAVVPPWILFILARRDLVAEQQRRPNFVAAQRQLWMLERFMDFTSAMVEVLAALRTQDTGIGCEAYARYQVAHRSLVQLIGEPVLEESLEFGNLLQQVMHAVGAGQWPSPQECALLDQKGTAYMQAMREELSAARKRLQAELAESYTNYRQDISAR